MKFPSIYSVLAGFCLMAAPLPLVAQPPGATTNATSIGPRMTFDTNEYHFGKVMAGEKVKHVFVLTNTGDETLIISNVAPGCHCTTVGDYSKAHRIAPGQTGEIPIQFDSTSFRGEVHKTILVTSNDKLAPRQTLILNGSIWRPLEISPQMARIDVMPDSTNSTSTVIHIIGQSDQPITLSNATSATDRFKAELKTIKPGFSYEVVVTAMPPLAAGNTIGTINVNTSLSNMPVLNITAIAMTQPALAVSPMQITLSPEIPHWTTNIVRINANTYKPLILSDLEASDKTIAVDLKEITQTHAFVINVVFPPGYKVPAGKQVTVTVKSNYREFPTIMIPVMQFPRQASLAQPIARPHPMTSRPTPPLPGVSSLPASAQGHP